VVIITGNASVAVDDVRSQLREAEADLDLEVVRVPINQPREVVRALQEAAGADAVAIVRGGGRDAQELDEDGLIGAVASAPVPVLAAVGHATDDLVLARVADASFPTPTALGAWLRETVEQRRLHERRLEEARLLSGVESLVEGVRQLEAAKRATAVWRVVAAVLAVALGAGVVWLLVRGV
jgi:exodeoxyribonuclease VII large subunit